ncbi:cytochrome P450 [Marinibaculum pumilum]|uniref:Cytochrome P450 n=1 Tax=Marinibaculum pumilum TaxID=1766165 RepID=A0ABV7KYM0_9PROT
MAIADLQDAQPSTRELPPPDLSHIPGPAAPPLIGHTVAIVKDGYAFHRTAIARYGEVYRYRMFGNQAVALSGPDALEFVLMDRDRIFSSQLGWDVIRRLFSRGLMLRDFDDHRRHRRIMQAAFKSPAMADYLARMNVELDRLVAAWPVDASFRFYPAVKALTLRLGGAVFMGFDTGSGSNRASATAENAEIDRINTAFIEEVRATVGLVRSPLPFTAMRRGVRSRAWLNDRFARLIAERRARVAQGGGGDDFFTQMCLATDEDGNRWSDDEIVDHFNFLLMAAHDTTSTALAKMAWALAAHPEWQARLADEVAALDGAPLTLDSLNRLEQTEWVFKEALRLMPPVPFLPRRAMQAFDWGGYRIPAGTRVQVSPGLVMASPELYTDPDRFDPERFSPDRAEDRRHRFAWAPFGGGAHKCIGMNFATMQVKAFTVALLSRRRLAPADGSATAWRRLPIPQPVGGLPVTLTVA